MHAGKKKKKKCPAFASELCACVLGHILSGYQDIFNNSAFAHTELGDQPDVRA